MIELVTEQEGLDELKKIIPKGVEFGVSAIQRHLKWGYNRAARAMELALSTRQAQRCESLGLYAKIKWRE